VGTMAAGNRRGIATGHGGGAVAAMGHDRIRTGCERSRLAVAQPAGSPMRRL